MVWAGSMSRSAMMALAIASVSLPPAAFGQQGTEASQSQQSAVSHLAWPRDYDLGDTRLEIYQPQIDTWDGTRITGRSALALGPKAGAPVYGTASFSARATIDRAAGLVHLDDITITKVDVVTAPDQESAVKQAIDQRLPRDGLTVALDQLQTSYAVHQTLAAMKTQPVDNTAPRILFADTLTLLVPVAGEPVLRPIAGVSGFERVINTRALILRDHQGAYHLQAAGTWYEARSFDAPWVVTPRPSHALEAAARIAVKSAAPDPLLGHNGKPIVPPPAILVSTVPTELIQTNGQPQMLPVSGTQLLSMNNADHAVFMNPDNNDFYVLISGRWFRGPGLKGPWAFVPSDALPADFARISPHDPMANVLVSVAGTPQAKEAAIAATLPQTAIVKRSASASVSYQGAPHFIPIEGTTLKYAINTPLPVIQVTPDAYYMVSDGVWFTAVSATGPWRVATRVPDEIYSIPVASPVHYVTYVRIYGEQPDAVVVGYTPGYMGVMVAPGGTVVYGTGYSCPGYVGVNAWYGCPTTYGYGAGFALSSAVGFGYGFASGWGWGASAAPSWGPYWGTGPYGGTWGQVNVDQANIYSRLGGQATVDHAWGTTANGTNVSGRAWSGATSWGTHFAGGSAAGFNPYTGNYGAAGANARYNPGTGAAGVSQSGIVGNTKTGNFDAERQSTGSDPTRGTAHATSTTVSRQNGELHVNSRGAVADARTGTAVGWNNGNIYADHDGHVYTHNDSGWSRMTNAGWQEVDHSQDMSELNREREAREWGGQRLEAYGDRFGADRFGGGEFHRAGFGGFRGGFRR